MVSGQHGSLQPAERQGRWLARAKCPECRVSFTCYPEGHYPRRQYQLDVVADAVVGVTVNEASAVQAGRAAAASATSIRRWTEWVGQLVDAGAVLGCAVKLDPDSPVGAGLSMLATSGSALRTAAARVLGALEHLAAAVLRCGVELASRTGLGRVLEWQHRYYGVYVALVAEPHRLSPPMALGLRPGGT